jgi:hypothetical protein
MPCAPSGAPLLGRDQGVVEDVAACQRYLDQPIVRYGHHDDLADGYEVLTELAVGYAGSAALNGCRWRGSVCELPLSEGAERVVVEALGPLPTGSFILCGGREAAVVERGAGWISEPVSVRDLDSLEIVAPGPATVAADGPRRTPQSRPLASGG